MANNLTETQRIVATALDAAFKRAEEQEQKEGALTFDIKDAKLVFFSDHHKGNRDGADDFRICERAYNAALAYYDRLGYTLVMLGDVEELWEEQPNTVLKAYPHTFELEGNFHRAGRYIRLWGNHDDAWSHADLVDQLLAPALGNLPLKTHETLILHLQDDGEEIGKLFLLHGHQGTLVSDRGAWFSRFFVRYIWRPIQRVSKFSFNSPAKDFQLRFEHDSALYCWSESQKGVVLIAGHTHRPVFKSETHEAIVRKSLAEAEENLAKNPADLKLQEQVADLAAELEWILVQNGSFSEDLVSTVDFRKPSYFNAGCCAFSDGDITGLEISKGEIRLVRWPDDKDNPKPKVLAKAKLSKVFKEISN